MKKKIIRIATIPVSLKVLLKGQLHFMNDYFHVVAVSSPGKELKEVEELEGVRVYSVEMSRNITPLKDIFSIIKLYFFFSKEKPYIVHTHTPKAGFVGMTAAFFARVPNRLHTVAGLPLMETVGIKRRILMQVEKFTYRLSSLILPNSLGLRNFIENNKLTSESKLRMIGSGSSNGIDLNHFRSSELTRNQASLLKEKYNMSDRFIFLFIGRMVSHKGVNELVSAFLKVNARYPETLLLLVGEFEKDLDPLSEDTIKRLDHQSIRYVGHQPDVRIFLEIADIFVFPSYREGFPNVVLQACAFNLPCIVTDIFGSNEIVKNNENGLVVTLKNENELVNAMALLYYDSELRIRLGKSNRIRVEKEFEQKHIWNSLLALYNSL
jgi:glycosyltransferase involved in cell wall biosynthesis